MALTLAELINLAATKLGVLGDGETLDAASSSHISNALTRAWAALDTYNLQVWALSSTPDEYADPFLEFAKWRYAPFFSKPIADPELQQLKGVRLLQDVINAPRNALEDRAEYF